MLFSSNFFCFELKLISEINLSSLLYEDYLLLQKFMIVTFIIAIFIRIKTVWYNQLILVGPCIHNYYYYYYYYYYYQEVAHFLLQ